MLLHCSQKGVGNLTKTVFYAISPMNSLDLHWEAPTNSDIFLLHMRKLEGVLQLTYEQLLLSGHLYPSLIWVNIVVCIFN